MRFDVFGMCNALFDIQAEVGDETLAGLNLSKGTMALLSQDEQRQIVPQVYGRIVHTEAGGSGANTMIGVALLGGTACYTSRVGRDEHGRMYKQGLAAQGVQPNLGEADGDTGISLILISPDAQRTMLTYLGLARELSAGDVNVDDLKNSKYLYVTGYLWDTENQKQAVLLAMREAKSAGVKVALSLSDPFCVGRHKADFQALLRDYVDVVFANKEEALALTDTDDPRAAAKLLAEQVDVVAITLDEKGSLLRQGANEYTIPVYPVNAVDTTGAGDMYAAGLLYGLSQGLPLPASGRIASYAAAQVVAKLGPRLQSIDRAMIAHLAAGGEF